jgi:hypothetical protein
MIELELSNGTIIEFPDGTPEKTIRQTARDHEQAISFGGRDAMEHYASGGLFDFDENIGGAMFGVANKLSGMGDYGESYAAYRDDLRKRKELNRLHHPGKTLGLEMAGGVAMPAGAAKAAAVPGLRNIPRLANLGQPRTMAQAANLGVPARMRTAAQLGATGGALQGAGMADDPDESMLGGALRGAAIGGLTGGLLEGGQATVVGGLRALNPKRRAYNALRRAHRRGRMTTPQLKRELSAKGPDTILADLNEGFLAELDKVVNSPGAARDKAFDLLDNRSRKQIDAILDTVGPGQYHNWLRQVKEAKGNVGEQLYKRAMGRDLPYNSNSNQDIFNLRELEDIWANLNRTGGNWFGSLRELASLEGAATGRGFPNLGSGTMPSLAGWDQLKRELWARGQAAWRAGDSSRARFYDQTRRRLVTALDNLNPDYKRARKFWQGAAEFEEQLDAGKTFFNARQSADDFDEMWRTMSNSERFAYREGSRQSIKDILEAAGETHDASKYFNSRKVKRKIMRMFGPSRGRAVLDRVNDEARKQRTYNTVRGNSATAFRQAMQREDNALNELFGTAIDLWQYPLGALRSAGRVGKTEAAREALGDILLESDPQKLMRIIDSLDRPGVYGAGPSAPLHRAIPFAAGSGMVNLGE